MQRWKSSRQTTSEINQPAKSIGGVTVSYTHLHYTPVKDSKAIPTGEIAPVEGTPFDFTEAKPIGRDIEANDTQLHYGRGYDHTFAIDKTAPGVEKVATAYSPESGIQLSLIHI